MANITVEDAMDHEGVEWLNHDDRALKYVECPEFLFVEENENEFVMHVKIDSDEKELRPSLLPLYLHHDLGENPLTLWYWAHLGHLYS